jgi:hypothetical protein
MSLAGNWLIAFNLLNPSFLGKISARHGERRATERSGVERSEASPPGQRENRLSTLLRAGLASAEPLPRSSPDARASRKKNSGRTGAVIMEPIDSTMTSTPPNQALYRLREIIKELDSVAIAFSGGTDSSYLLAVCLDVLGPEQTLALTADSPLTPRFELDDARTLAGQLRARHIVLAHNDLANPHIVANPPNRCYHCKLSRFDAFLSMARMPTMPPITAPAARPLRNWEYAPPCGKRNWPRLTSGPSLGNSGYQRGIDRPMPAWPAVSPMAPP